MKIRGFAYPAILALALTGCSQTTQETVTYSGDYPYYDTVAALCEDSQLVVLVTALSSEVRKVDLSATPGDSAEEDPNLGAEDGGSEAEPFIVVETVTTARIEEIYKGVAAVGDTLEVGQPGGVFEEVRYEADRFDLKEGSESLLFLNVWENDVPASPLNPTQGAYALDANGALIPADGNGAVKSSTVFADKRLCSAP